MMQEEDDVEANLYLADFNGVDNGQSEELQQLSANVERVIKEAELKFAPQTLFWGSEHNHEEMEVLLKLQLRAKRDMDERRQSPVVGVVWSDSKYDKRATEMELKERRSVACQVQLFDCNDDQLWEDGVLEELSMPLPEVDAAALASLRSCIQTTAGSSKQAGAKARKSVSWMEPDGDGKCLHAAVAIQVYDTQHQTTTARQSRVEKRKRNNQSEARKHKERERAQKFVKRDKERKDGII
jgi:hypothetical protein